MALSRIVSGGQTGVDRAALDVALALGIACGGWCPRGRRAEDGPIDRRYPLRETPESAYHVRTARNVAETDGTLILARGPLSGGTRLTRDLAREHGRPLLVLDPGRADPAAVGRWVAEHGVAVLNVAGPRESSHPGIYAAAYAFLLAALEER